MCYSEEEEGHREELELALQKFRSSKVNDKTAKEYIDSEYQTLK